MTSTTMHVVKFRNKFQNWLSKTGVPEAIVAMAFTIAMKMDEDSFFWLLWKLSFDVCREKSLNKLGLTTDETSTEKDLEFIPNELVQPLRNELRYQYQQVHEEFLSGYDSEEELYNATGKDIIFTAGIIKRLYKYIKNQRDLDKRNRVIFLLRYGKENLVFGNLFVFSALRELGFTNAESEVLFPKTGIIASVFEKMASKPFAGLGEMIDTSTLPDVPTEVEEPQKDEEVSQEEPDSSDYQPLNTQVVLANTKLLKEFFGVVSQLDEVGIDLYEALEKEAQIRALICSLEALS